MVLKVDVSVGVLNDYTTFFAGWASLLQPVSVRENEVAKDLCDFQNLFYVRHG